MKLLMSFLAAVFSQWLVLMGGAALITILGILERFRGKDVSVRLYLGIMALFVLYACFLAWRDERIAVTACSGQLTDAKKEIVAQKQLITDCDKTTKDREQLIQQLQGKLIDAVSARPVEVKLPPSAAETAPTPPEGLRLTVKNVASPKEDSPFALEATIQTSTTVQQIALVVKCNEQLDGGHFVVVGQPIMTQVKSGVGGSNKDSYFVEFATPPLTPQSPLVITLYAKKAFKITSVERVPYQW